MKKFLVRLSCGAVVFFIGCLLAYLFVVSNEHPPLSSMTWYVVPLPYLGVLFLVVGFVVTCGARRS